MGKQMGTAQAKYGKTPSKRTGWREARECVLRDGYSRGKKLQALAARMAAALSPATAPNLSGIAA
jgi:hypothetical protein